MSKSVTAITKIDNLEGKVNWLIEIVKKGIPGIESQKQTQEVLIQGLETKLKQCETKLSESEQKMTVKIDTFTTDLQNLK